jgi:PKD repeat protein
MTLEAFDMAQTEINQRILQFSRMAFSAALAATLFACGGGGGSGSGPELSSAVKSIASGVTSLKASTPDGQIYGASGKSIQAGLSLATSTDTLNEDIVLSTESSGDTTVILGPFGWSIITIAPTNGTAAVKIIAKNSKTGGTDIFSVLVNGIATQAALTGNITDSGGSLTSLSGAVVKFPSNNLASPVGGTVRETSSPTGETLVSITLDRDVSASDLKITFPDLNRGFDSVANAAATDTEATTKSTSIARKAMLSLDQTAIAYATDKNSLGHLWTDGNCLQKYEAYFNVSNARVPADREIKWGHIASFRGHTAFVNKNVSAELHSVAPCTTKTLDIGSVEPVLFVHGFLPATLGGGQATWANFPELAKASGFLPFEFRWKTNARFVDAAGDLARAIKTIHVKTGGKKVHIVAHSFGGVLVRTVLQGLSNNVTADMSSNLESKIASVTTLGSPFSGISFTPVSVFSNDRLEKVSLPKGEDAKTIGACLQISCHVLGKALPNLDEKDLAIFGISPTGGEHAATLLQTANQLPPVPIATGIGLRVDVLANKPIYGSGDSLISYQGQRFSPIDGEKPLRSASKVGMATVTETVLGTVRDVRPNYILNLVENAALNRKGGYLHSSITGITSNETNSWSTNFSGSDSVDMGLEAAPTINCDSVVLCDHAGFLLFRKNALANSSINRAPAAAITYTTAPLVAGNSVSFSGATSSDPEGSLATYEWKFGDGATAVGVIAAHTFASAGSYTVSLTVTDKGGLKDMALSVAVVSAAPVVCVPPSSLANGVCVTPVTYSEGVVLLNDTGITTCSDYVNVYSTTSNTIRLSCAFTADSQGDPIPPRQDALYGRDARAADGTLVKIGFGPAGFDFTKLDNAGNVLPENAQSWTCLKDNHTKLVWEVKTSTKAFTWYSADGATNGGVVGTKNIDSNTQDYVAAVNATNLCGASNWRLPELEELRSTINYTPINPLGSHPSKLITGSYWSSSVDAYDPNYAWAIDRYGTTYNVVKSGTQRVILVRNSQ